MFARILIKSDSEIFPGPDLDSNGKQSQKVSNELLLSLMTAPSGKCKFLCFMNISYGLWLVNFWGEGKVCITKNGEDDDDDE